MRWSGKSRKVTWVRKGTGEKQRAGGRASTSERENKIRIGYRLRWRSDIWRTDRGVAEVRSPGIRPATDDDIRHNAPGLLLNG